MISTKTNTLSWIFLLQISTVDAVAKMTQGTLLSAEVFTICELSSGF